MTQIIMRIMLVFMGVSAIILVTGVVAGIIEIIKLVKAKANV